jgi:hypothetical protein
VRTPTFIGPNSVKSFGLGAAVVVAGATVVVVAAVVDGALVEGAGAIDVDAADGDDDAAFVDELLHAASNSAPLISNEVRV